MRCRTREGPIGSHQLLAREEKWESSSAETEEGVVEWRRHGIVVVEVVVFLREVRARVVGRKVILFCLLGVLVWLVLLVEYSWSGSSRMTIHLLQIQKLIWVGL